MVWNFKISNLYISYCKLNFFFEVLIQMSLRVWAMAMRMSHHLVEGMKGELQNGIYSLNRYHFLDCKLHDNKNLVYFMHHCMSSAWPIIRPLNIYWKISTHNNNYMHMHILWLVKWMILFVFSEELGEGRMVAGIYTEAFSFSFFFLLQQHLYSQSARWAFDNSCIK